MQSIQVISGTDAVGSLGWRHFLAWRQLAEFWQIKITARVDSEFRRSNPSSAACSVALSGDEPWNAGGLREWMATTPVVVFLKGAGVQVREDDGSNVFRSVAVYRPDSQGPQQCDLEAGHRFLDGLPRRIEVFASGTEFTSLDVPDGDVLVRIDGRPVVVFKAPLLYVGADPWQLGNPGFPVLYAILSRWLGREVRHRLRVLPPHALVRLDDLPATAEQAVSKPLTPGMDRRQARVLRRMRRFAGRHGIVFNPMYTSHVCEPAGRLNPIAEAMPQSMREMAQGVRQGAFEIGSHGMVHLRQVPPPPGRVDPREFLDLDESETDRHLRVCEEEIERRFGVRPSGFVAPAWGYRPGVTKRVAGSRYEWIVDSSQHVEAGECDVMLTRESEGGYVNLCETFRPGSRMLNYANPDFWRCYAVAGIPIHYMQHSDRSWNLVREFVKGLTRAGSSEPAGVRRRLLARVEDTSSRPLVRIACSVLLVAIGLVRGDGSFGRLWRILMRSSLYAFVRAMQQAGYRCAGFSEFGRAMGVTASSTDPAAPSSRSASPGEGTRPDVHRGGA